MKITLTQWLAIQAATKKAVEAIEALETVLIDTTLAHKKAGNDAEAILLLDLAQKAALVHGSWGFPFNSVHPKSEWMGGDETKPENHKLREPEIVGFAGRYFTEAEMEEVGARNLGPCRWEFKPQA